MNSDRQLPGTDPTRCQDPYSFGPFQEALGQDFWSDDPELARLLAHHGLDEQDALTRLASWGQYVASTAADGADRCDRPENLPRIMPSDSYGRPHPVGVELPAETSAVLAASLRAGLAYEPQVMLRYALVYLSAQIGDAGVLCPLACTDGLVRALQELDAGEPGAAALQRILEQPGDEPIHGAQFVTEAQGGSDAGTNRVRAERQQDGSYRLFGQKWFCSNIPAQYWAVTARPVDAPSGSRGVALFLVPRELSDGTANGFRVERIKDKLGTRSLPTVEMTLDGAIAYPLGAEREGLSNMVRIVLSTSRFWCAIAAVGFIRSAERVASAYASFRAAFGQPIASYPLVADSLARLRRSRRELLAANLEILATWERVAAAERAGQTPAGNDALRARLLIMMTKMTCTRQATALVHEAMMILGGNGIEERFSPLPRLLRDAIILETWEGPHGLLTARLLLDIQKYGGADAPHGLVGMLLGLEETTAEVQSLGDELAELLHDQDPSRQMLSFSRWLERLFLTFGAICWKQVDP